MTNKEKLVENTILALQGKLQEDKDSDIISRVGDAIQDFDDNNHRLRYKGVDTEIKDNTLIIEYQTQEDITNSDVDKFIKSIMPSIKYILQNIDNSITEIKIYMFDRANHRFNKSFIVSEDKNINRKKTDQEKRVEHTADIISKLNSFDPTEFSNLLNSSKDYSTYLEKLDEFDKETNRFKVDWVNELENVGIKTTDQRKQLYNDLYMIRGYSDTWKEFKNTLKSIR